MKSVQLYELNDTANDSDSRFGNSHINYVLLLRLAERLKELYLTYNQMLRIFPKIFKDKSAYV